MGEPLFDHKERLLRVYIAHFRCHPFFMRFFSFPLLKFEKNDKLLIT